VRKRERKGVNPGQNCMQLTMHFSPRKTRTFLSICLARLDHLSGAVPRVLCSTPCHGAGPQILLVQHAVLHFNVCLIIPAPIGRLVPFCSLAAFAFALCFSVIISFAHLPKPHYRRVIVQRIEETWFSYALTCTQSIDICKQATAFLDVC
jgi:hypothetical protein